MLRLSLTSIYCGVDYSALCAGYRSNANVAEDGFHCLIDKLIIYENKDYHMDCAEVLENGNTESRVHTIWRRSRFAECASIDVQCDLVTDGGGWTVELGYCWEFKISLDIGNSEIP
ncbi:hypothetical protein AVEN_198969-1, partial [Araneus ventricosus]